MEEFRLEVEQVCSGHSSCWAGRLLSRDRPAELELEVQISGMAHREYFVKFSIFKFFGCSITQAAGSHRVGSGSHTA